MAIEADKTHVLQYYMILSFKNLSFKSMISGEVIK